MRLYRESLALLVSRNGAITLVGTAENAADGLTNWPAGSYEVVLFDLVSGGAANEGVCRFVEERPQSRIVALGVSGGNGDVPHGVSAYLTRTCGLDQLIEAVGRVAGNSNGAPSAKEPPMSTRLTDREIEVLHLIDRGLSNYEIGQRLYIEVATVKNHVHNILRKLDVKSRALAVVWLRKHEPHIAVQEAGPQI
jgi:DNA-binding NarL/FixJ family response regulator